MIFAPTPPQSSYLTAVAAGPYHRVDGGVADAAPREVALGVLCRASLAEHLDADEILDVTRARPGLLRASTSASPTRGASTTGVRARIQPRRDGEPRAGHVHRGLRAPRRGHPHGRDGGRHDPARDGAHVVRRPGHDALVGRPVAQGVVRRLMGTSSAPRPPSRPTRGRRFAGRRKAWAYTQDQLPTTHPIVAEIDDLEAASRTSTASPTPRARRAQAAGGLRRAGGVLRGRPRVFPRTPSAAPSSTTCSGCRTGVGPRPAGLVAGLAADVRDVPAHAAGPDRPGRPHDPARGGAAATDPVTGAAVPPAPPGGRALRADRRGAAPRTGRRDRRRRRPDRGPRRRGRPGGAGAAQRRRPHLRESAPGSALARRRPRAPDHAPDVAEPGAGVGGAVGRDARRRAAGGGTSTSRCGRSAGSPTPHCSRRCWARSGRRSSATCRRPTGRPPVPARSPPATRVCARRRPGRTPSSPGPATSPGPRRPARPASPRCAPCSTATARSARPSTPTCAGAAGSRWPRRTPRRPPISTPPSPPTTR